MNPANNPKSDLQEALKSKFYLTSVFVFWLLTGVAFIYAVVSTQSSEVQSSTELSSQAP